MQATDLLRLAVVLCYLAVTALSIAGMLGRREMLKRAALVLAGTGFLLHSVLLALNLAALGAEAFHRSFFHLSFLAWFLMLVFFFVRWKLKLEFLALTSAPLALLAFLSSLAVTARVTLPKSLSGPFLALHIGSLFVSLGLLAMAFGAGGLFLHMEKKIKRKEKLSGFRSDLPSLSAFDRVNHWAVVAGFPLYTIGLVSGFVWGRFTFGRVFGWDPKEIVSVVIWVLYALLFHQRLAAGWRGRKAAVLAIIVFICSAVSIAGVNFLLPTHHSFTPQP